MSVLKIQTTNQISSARLVVSTHDVNISFTTKIIVEMNIVF